MYLLVNYIEIEKAEMKIKFLHFFDVIVARANFVQSKSSSKIDKCNLQFFLQFTIFQGSSIKF